MSSDFYEKWCKNARLTFFTELGQKNLTIYVKDREQSNQTKTEKDTCNPVFIAALFTIARMWKQHRCPPTNERIRKLQYIYATEYLSALERNTCESVLTKWTNLERIIQIEVSQKEKDKFRTLTHIYGI